MYMNICTWSDELNSNSSMYNDFSLMALAGDRAVITHKALSGFPVSLRDSGAYTSMCDATLSKKLAGLVLRSGGEGWRARPQKSRCWINERQQRCCVLYSVHNPTGHQLPAHQHPVSLLLSFVCWDTLPLCHQRSCSYTIYSQRGMILSMWRVHMQPLGFVCWSSISSKFDS